MKTRILVVSVFIFFVNAASLADSASIPHTSDPTRSKRPVQEPIDNGPSLWNFWNLKEKVVGAYDDTMTWDIDLVFGKKAIDNLGKAVLEFLSSPEGNRFVFRNKKTFLFDKLEDTAGFEKSFWADFDSWLSKKGYQPVYEEYLKTAVNLLPRQPKLNVKVLYPQSPIRSTVVRGVDHIQYLLADDMAAQMDIGRIAPRIVANSIRRAAQGQAILSSVQTSYNQSRNSLTNRIVHLIEVVAKKLVQQGVEKSKLDVQVDFSISPWEKTKNFKENPTFPIRSYFYAKNSPHAIVPYQVTKFLDSLDNYDFEKDVRRIGN